MPKQLREIFEESQTQKLFRKFIDFVEMPKRLQILKASSNNCPSDSMHNEWILKICRRKFERFWKSFKRQSWFRKPFVFVGKRKRF